MTDTRAQPPIQQPLHWVGEDWPRYLSPKLVKERTWLVVVAAVAIGMAFDLAIRSQIIGVAGAMSMIAAAGFLLVSGRLRNPQAYAIAALAPLFAMWLVFRTSGWLVPLDLLVACGLIALAASMSSGGSVWDLTFTGVVSRGVQAGVQALFAPAFLLRTPDGSRKRPAVGGVVRGLAIALPVVAALMALLASADAVFASFIEFDFANLVGHVFLFVIGALAMAAVLRLASIEHTDEPRVPRAHLGVTEWTVVLVALNVVLGAFAVARIVSLTEGGQRVIESAGLTYAEYARSGFFQLIGAALLATGSLVALRSVADFATARQRTWFVALALGVVVLTLAMVVSAFHRIVLYESVFGLTMLRIYAQTATVWIGIVLVLLGARVAGVGSNRAWLTGTSVLTALALLFALNVMNPESFVARYNISHEQQPADFDAPYLADLGDDAVPAVVGHPDVKRYVCTQATDGPRGWAAHNFARERAKDIRARVCKGG